MNIDEFAEQYYQTEFSGVESVSVESAKIFAQRWADVEIANCNCRKEVKCNNCDEMVVMTSLGELCPSCCVDQ